MMPEPQSTVGLHMLAGLTLGQKVSLLQVLESERAVETCHNFCLVVRLLLRWPLLFSHPTFDLKTNVGRPAGVEEMTPTYQLAESPGGAHGKSLGPGARKPGF